MLVITVREERNLMGPESSQKTTLLEDTSVSPDAIQRQATIDNIVSYLESSEFKLAWYDFHATQLLQKAEGALEHLNARAYLVHVLKTLKGRR
ncbi:MAG: hypothetical protein ACXABY_10005 [Candidatus Thorarchaeota archaeon]|jgi:hypothetical protein